MSALPKLLALDKNDSAPAVTDMSKAVDGVCYAGLLHKPNGYGVSD